ncbi:uncharacterized protein LOC119295348 [Triticum dicoccoides]|uniref:uncharacterized protein LOC119295348 n=1 Tax=Triticum dicoccoides TaxID=85692 RepID=UPI000E7BFB3F|nr:uncharacterized protein LOC119295348 [Triticum dicoccoides]
MAVEGAGKGVSSMCCSSGELQRRGAGKRMLSRVLADSVDRSGLLEWAKYLTTGKIEVLYKQWMLGCDHKAVPFSTTKSQSGHVSSVFKLVHYELVLQCLKKLPGVVVQDIPYRTSRAVQNAGTNCASDKEVDELLIKLPGRLRDALLYHSNLKV